MSGEPDSVRYVRERELAEQVRTLCELYGWRRFHVLDSRGMTAGWPDEVLIHPGRNRVLFLELKSPKGVVSYAQQWCLTALAAAGMEVGVIRPQDLPYLARVLGPVNAPLDHLTWRTDGPNPMPGSPRTVGLAGRVEGRPPGSGRVRGLSRARRMPAGGTG